MPASRKLHMSFTAAFLLLIGIVAPSQILWELRDGEQPQIADLFRQTPTRASLRQLESGLESNCRLAQMIRPWMQYARFVLLEDAGDKAVIGRGAWLFYRPAVQYLIEPWSSSDDIFAAILSFRDDLAKRGIELLVMPAPNKASIYPEMLAAGAAGVSEPVNAKTKDVLARLKSPALRSLICSRSMSKARQTVGSPDYYLARDSHWSPEGMRLAADAVAQAA